MFFRLHRFLAKNSRPFWASEVVNSSTGHSKKVRLDIAPYITYGLQTTFSPSKSATIALGIRNLTDEKPPFVFSQGGINRGQELRWDGRYCDPRGRTAEVLGLVNRTR